MGISLFKRKCYNKKCSRSFHKNSGIFFSTFSEYIFTLPDSVESLTTYVFPYNMGISCLKK